MNLSEESLEEEFGYSFFLSELIHPKKAMEKLKKQIPRQGELKSFFKNLENKNEESKKDSPDFCSHRDEDYYEAYEAL